MTQAPSILILACGNASRGDDALGPKLIERLNAMPSPILRLGQAFDSFDDFQLQIEHVLDIQGRERVLFVDAALSGPEPFSFGPVIPEPALSITTHALSPGGLLRVYQEAIGGQPPDCHLLAIRGYAFELGAVLSPGAEANLAAALAFLAGWLRIGTDNPLRN
ncbi:hydrogenase maturation protease [uncultured Thiodictyon sp.]|uniref:hydrogenase maturation protease n=1 Tax=uncultured Thiodictyon sp. TaxID=1846217 RepID=UPI0025D2B340|nr:hydrogenase maturation protease [uncultured Thiodictyon sp.]